MISSHVKFFELFYNLCGYFYNLKLCILVLSTNKITNSQKDDTTYKNHRCIYLPWPTTKLLIFLRFQNQHSILKFPLKTFDSEGNISDFIAYAVVLFMKEAAGRCKSNKTMDWVVAKYRGWEEQAENCILMTAIFRIAYKHCSSFYFTYKHNHLCSCYTIPIVCKLRITEHAEEEELSHNTLHYINRNLRLFVS
jgi:hypothetical protein